MTKKRGTGDKKQGQAKQGQASRQEIDAALARLENIAKNLPPVDAAAIVREGRDGRIANEMIHLDNNATTRNVGQAFLPVPRNADLKFM